ncbi:Asp-tRNA(Asn)/Glu-tRNA(Gln) amidotransferase subunit GatC [Inconstantimicrobium mannanitabidum]|uniref:Glutamyl-tRNA(Gln) amidotransferase subunit C 2 n=1 Tax=Inconstantimicrobium mannanitabidum TaxID=1604901 RepID=A0ACB5RI65_9CLOT|nr:Asp-tRNA(Asn)/Glu-tRNA(Gln) amidotransferase subunit GatC [Clostridium sp. TW13]GKX68768.1 glutamyl-tRNA(Gln) amidotransferase subunit C 2 [Clostridium sp. TW13]
MAKTEVTIEEVQYVAKLAKLKFTEEDLKKMTEQFQDILGHFEDLDKLDLSDIDLTKMEDTNKDFRKDIPQVFEDKKKLMQNVKTLRDGAIEVPKILD